MIKDATGAVKGERSLTSRGADCEELAAATSLTVSILLNPTRRPRSTQASPIPEPPPTLPTLQVAPREPPAEVPEAKPATKTPIHLRVVADATGSIGLLPAPSVGVLAGPGSHGRLSLDVEVRGDALASKTFGARDVSASFVAGGLTPCVRVGPARACGVAQLGVLRAAVTDATPATVAAAVLLLGPRLGVSLPLASWLALDAHADALFAPTVKVRVDTGDIWSSSVVSGLLGLGVIGSFCDGTAPRVAGRARGASSSHPCVHLRIGIRLRLQHASSLRSARSRCGRSGSGGLHRSEPASPGLRCEPADPAMARGHRLSRRREVPVVISQCA